MSKTDHTNLAAGAWQDKGLHRFCVAPMMDWTDRHCRYFMRLLSRHTFLYTEMVTTGALLHGDSDRFLHFDEAEHPVALQLGGSEPQALAQCSRMAEKRGYDEVNLNVGCPSDRVQTGRIGACLMSEPALVAQDIRAMQDAVSIPVSIKTRIGIDDMDSDQALIDFIGTIAETGCRLFILHARIAILQGLSPKENREVPPLNYDRVFLIKHHFPQLEIVINGGIRNLDQAEDLLSRVDGVMLGREAYQNPGMLNQVDQRLFGSLQSGRSPHAALADFLPYVEKELAHGAHLHHMSRHVLGLFQGQPGAKKFRRYLSENAHRRDAGVSTLKQAVALVGK